MKIVYKIIIPFSLGLIILIGTMTFFIIYYVDTAITQSEINKMQSTMLSKQFQIQALHEGASEDLIFALKNPKFLEYFELPETKKGNVYDENNILQFTEKQKAIKQELEQWMYHFQNKFSVDETCLIDVSGQEHIRLVLTKIEDDENLSPNEKLSDFFTPSFIKQKDDVHIQYPYISPDTDRMVFAYTSPVVLGGGVKPAIYHFEMPIEIFQKLMDVEEGRMYVLDPDGFIIVDSGISKKSPNLQNDFQITNKVFSSVDIIHLAENSISEHNGVGTYTQDGEINHILFSKMPYFGWILAYEKPHSLLLTGVTNINELYSFMIVTSLIIVLVGTLSIIKISSRISNPIISLNKATSLIEQGHYDIRVAIDSSDELGELGKSFNKMALQLKKSEIVFEAKTRMEIEFMEMKKNDELKTEFLAMVSHELKTPLIPIQTYTDMLLCEKFGKITELQKNKLDLIKSSCSSLIHLISDLLDTQKLELNKLKMNKENVDMKNTIENAIQIVKPIADQRKIKINFTFLNIVILHDPERIKQVLTNIMKNSLNAVANQTGIIEVFCEEQDSEIKICIRDNGDGILESSQKNIFKKFYQVDTSLTRKIGGSGLGLGICKGIIELHGGRIWFDSIEGKGTTMFFTIPKYIYD